MIDWHKRHVEFWKSKLGVNDYGMLWIAWMTLTKILQRTLTKLPDI